MAGYSASGRSVLTISVVKNLIMSTNPVALYAVQAVSGERQRIQSSLTFVDGVGTVVQIGVKVVVVSEDMFSKSPVESRIF